MHDHCNHYLLQLHQVETGLLSDPNNADLLKLRENLQEVINLSSQQLNTSSSNQSATSHVDNNDNSGQSSQQVLRGYTFKKAKSLRIWKAGDHCMAKWSKTNQYQEAVIDAIFADRSVNVTFVAYRNRAKITLDDIRPVPSTVVYETDKKRNGPSFHQREYLTEKKLKKQQRLQEIERNGEIEKNKWLAFNKKITCKGTKMKSIFASPQNMNGKVGIGTCGISGKPMTEFSTPVNKLRKT